MLTNVMRATGLIEGRLEEVEALRGDAAALNGVTTTEPDRVRVVEHFEGGCKSNSISRGPHDVDPGA
jgi:hypothetical protein